MAGFVWQVLLLPDASGDEAAVELLEWFNQEACNAYDPHLHSRRHASCYHFQREAAPAPHPTKDTASTGHASGCQAISAKSSVHAGTNWQSSKALHLRAR